MKPFIPILVAAAGLGLHATPVAAGSSRSIDVTTGQFVTLPGGVGLDLDVRGHAVMKRSDRDGGWTTVAVRARGLRPNTTYPTHVHNQPCSWSPAGGSHYQHVPGPPPAFVNPVNEMWPAIVTDDKGRGVGYAEHGHRARSDAQSIVVHEPTDTSIRIACLDLS
ncbi:MAG: hypothetical protein HKN41_13860 [Ilumatobacter sp.]|nr:hypothetical protein [Ilumatobacter sp.]